MLVLVLAHVLVIELSLVLALVLKPMLAQKNCLCNPIRARNLSKDHDRDRTCYHTRANRSCTVLAIATTLGPTYKGIDQQKQM